MTATHIWAPSQTWSADMSDTTQDVEHWDPDEDDTIIVPIEDDYALVIGPNTKGFEKIDSSLVADRALTDLIASIGEGASLTGGAASATNAIQHMSGLYKLDAATKAHLAAGNALTKAADGRLIGSVRNASGQITHQARLIPVSAPQIAGAIAAIGPAVAMVAVQMQLNNISKQVSAVQQTVLQTQRLLEDWNNADFHGTRRVVLRIHHKATEEGTISNTNWEQISGLSNAVERHRDYYKERILRHAQKLQSYQNNVSERRNYIIEHRESILFDSFAAFSCIQTWCYYFELAHERARMNGERPTLTHDEIRAEVEDDVQIQRTLLRELMRELRIISELPGEWTFFLSQKQKDKTDTHATAVKLLEQLNELAQQLGIKENPAPNPDVTCAPTDYDTSPYTEILRWCLNEGERLRGLAFPVDALTHRVVVPAIDKIRSTPSVDSAWANLPKPEDTTEWSRAWFGRAVGQRIVVAPEMVAITDRRIITADPQEFIQKGITRENFAINELTPTFVDADDTLPELHITQGEKKCREWRFPSAARSEARSIAEMLVDEPTQLLPPTKSELTSTQRDEIETSEKGDPESAQNREPKPNGTSPEPGTEEAPAEPTA